VSSIWSLRFGPSVEAEGAFTAPMGDRRFAFVNARDVARVSTVTMKTVK
jgi:uncharacterized protein YbjT (DUF2867 family)